MSKLWGWLIAASLAIVGVLAYLLGRKGRRSVVVTDPRPKLNAELEASAVRATHELEKVDDLLVEQFKHSGKTAAVEAAALVRNRDRLRMSWKSSLRAARTRASDA